MGLVSELMNRPQPAANAYDSYLKLKTDAPEKAALEAKIKTLRQAAATAQARPGPGTASPPPATAPAPGTALPPAAPPQAAAQKPAEHGPTDLKPPERPTPPRPGMPPQARQPIPPPPAGVDFGIPGVPPIPVDADALVGIAMGAGIIGLILGLVSYIVPCLMLYLIAKKTSTSLPWLAFIPIANVVLAINIAGKPIWWLVLLFGYVIGVILAGAVSMIDPTGGIIPTVLFAIGILVTVVAGLFVCLGIASARGKSIVWGILLFIPCTSFIALLYLGLSK